MSTYTKCDSDTQTLVRKMLKMFNGDLVNAGITLDLLFAMASNETSPAVSFGGYPALAVVKITSLKDRVAGLADASIVIDELAWKDMTAEGKNALIDHELYHLIVKRTDTGAVKEDDCGRPKLKLRKHDWQTGGFYEIVQRHQMAAVDAQVIEEVHAKFQQGYLFASLTGY